MKQRHVCDSLECVICSPDTAHAYSKGRFDGGAEAEKWYQEAMRLRKEIENAVCYFESCGYYKPGIDGCDPEVQMALSFKRLLKLNQSSQSKD